jgi:hypothetical protein
LLDLFFSLVLFLPQSLEKLKRDFGCLFLIVAFAAALALLPAGAPLLYSC